MRELDALLGRFLKTRYSTLTAREMTYFERILELPDPELYGYLLGRGCHSDPELAALIERIRDNPRA